MFKRIIPALKFIITGQIPFKERLLEGLREGERNCWIEIIDMSDGTKKSIKIYAADGHVEKIGFSQNFIVSFGLGFWPLYRMLTIGHKAM